MPAAGILGLALLASISGITNQFAQDDFGIILKNAAVHDLRHGLRFFGEPYWPAPLPPELYRPMALLWYAVQWAIGAGSPLIFRIVSYLLYAGACLATLRLARLTLPAAAAFAVAALFAVHPVHVEVVASIENRKDMLAMLLGATSMPAPPGVKESDGELVEIERFHQIVRSASPHRFDCARHAPFRCHDDGHCALRNRFVVKQQEALAIRQVQIKQREIEFQPTQCLTSVSQTGHRRNLCTCLSELCSDTPAQ